MEEKKIIKKIDFSKMKLPTKLLFLQKLSSSNSQKNLINSKISEYFFSPDKYFERNPRILINKKIDIKKIGQLKVLNQSVRSNLAKSSDFRDKLLTNFNKNSIKDDAKYKKFETIDNERLKSIFNSYKISKKIIHKGNILMNNSLNNNNIPMQLSLDLDSQNRILNKKTKYEKKNRQMSKYLSRKLCKNEDCLLINNIQPYCYKKQIINNENSKNPINNNIHSYILKWISSLRIPKEFIGKKESYINVGADNNNPLWSTVVEKYPDSKEISVKSEFNSEKRFDDDIIKNNKFNLIDNDKIKDFENLEKINIKEKNLYNLEYDREMSSNRKKKWYKAFVDNGKMIMYKDVNRIFGNETIYKDYFGRNKNIKSRNILPKSHSMSNIKVKNMYLKY